MNETLNHAGPRRRFFRPRNILLSLLGVFLALIAWAGYWINWAYTVEPNPSVDYAAQMGSFRAMRNCRVRTAGRT